MKQAVALKQVNIKMPFSTYERLKHFSEVTGKTVQSVLIVSSDEYLQRQEQLMAIERESTLSWQEYLLNNVEDVAELQTVIADIRSRAQTALTNQKQ